MDNFDSSLRPGIGEPDPALLVKNLQALSRHVELCAKLLEVEPYGVMRVREDSVNIGEANEGVSFAKTGHPILSLPGEDGILRPLHSKFRPIEEAAGLFPGKHEVVGTCILLGAGLGYSALH